MLKVLGIAIIVLGFLSFAALYLWMLFPNLEPEAKDPWHTILFAIMVFGMFGMIWTLAVWDATNSSRPRTQ